VVDETQQYSAAEMDRMMKVQDVLLNATAHSHGAYNEKAEREKCLRMLPVRMTRRRNSCRT
jgi:hypothetical protein